MLAYGNENSEPFHLTPIPSLHVARRILLDKGVDITSLVVVSDEFRRSPGEFPKQ